MANISLISIVDTAKIGIRNVPFSTGEIFFPILDTIIVFVTRVFSARWVCFPRVKKAVPVRILITIIECITSVLLFRGSDACAGFP